MVLFPVPIKSCYALSGDSIVFWTRVTLKFNQRFIGARSEDGYINKISEGYITTQGHPPSSTQCSVYCTIQATLLIKKWFRFGSGMGAILLGSLFLYSIMAAIKTLRSHRKRDELLHTGYVRNYPHVEVFILDIHHLGDIMIWEYFSGCMSHEKASHEGFHWSGKRFGSI